MRSYSWRGLLAASLGLFAAGADAQTGAISDLGSLLAGQKNLTTFYALIQVGRSDHCWETPKHVLI
jgi:transforming growth factor-beta-induced protein